MNIELTEAEIMTDSNFELESDNEIIIGNLSYYDYEENDSSPITSSNSSSVSSSLSSSTSSVSNQLHFLPEHIKKKLMQNSNQIPSVLHHNTTNNSNINNNNITNDPSIMVSTQTSTSFPISSSSPSKLLPILHLTPSKSNQIVLNDNNLNESNILIDKSSTPRLPELTSSLTSTPSCTTPLRSLNYSSTNNSSTMNSPAQSPRPPVTPSSSQNQTFNFNEDINNTSNSSVSSVSTSAPPTSSFLKKNRKTKVLEDTNNLSCNTSSSSNINNQASSSLSNSPSTSSIMPSSSSSSLNSNQFLENINSLNSVPLSQSPSTLNIIKNALKHSNSTSNSVTLNNMSVCAVSTSSTSFLPFNSLNLPDSLSFQSNSQMNVIKIIPFNKTPCLIGACSDSNLYVYSLLDGKKIHTLNGHSDRVISLAVYLDDNNLIDPNRFKTSTSSRNEPVLLKSDLETRDKDVIDMNTKDEINLKRKNKTEKKDIQTSTLISQPSVSPLRSTPPIACAASSLKGSSSTLSSIPSLSTSHAASISSTTIYSSNHPIFILSGSRDNTIRLWDLETLRCIHKIRAHQSPVWGVEISVNIITKSFSLISSSNSGSIKVFDGYTGKLKYTLKGHSEKIYSLCSIFINNEQNNNSYYNSAPTPLKRSTSSASSNSSIHSESSFQCNGILFSAGSDKFIHCWDLERGKHIKSIEAHSEDITSLSVSSFKGLAALKPILLEKDYELNKVIDDVGSLIIVSGCKDNSIRVWEFLSGSLMFELLGHNKSITSLKLTCIPLNPQFNPNNTNLISIKSLKPGTPILISCSEDGQLKLWNILNGKLINTTKLGKNLIGNIDVRMFSGEENEQNIFVASCNIDKSINVNNILNFFKKGSISCSIC